MLRAAIPQDTITNATLRYLNQSYVDTVDHVKYLIKLENNISYDPAKLELELQRLRVAKNLEPEKDKPKVGIALPQSNARRVTFVCKEFILAGLWWD